MSPLERLERVALWIAVTCGTLGFLTSAGCANLPELPSAAVPWLHLLLFPFGAAAGLFATRRGAEIDRRRWQIVQDPSLTSGEIDWAHKNAENSRRWAGSKFLAAPVLLGYWMAYQVEGRGATLAAQLLAASALVGYFGGLVLARLREDPAGLDPPGF